MFARFLGSFELVRVAVPQGFGRLPEAERASAALDVIHETMRALGALRGWDASRLDDVRRRVEQRGLRFRWAGGWKSAPGRRHQARGLYWLDGDGHGHVQLEIRRAPDGVVVARSTPEPAFMTVEGFKRSAATLRWLTRDTVTVVPWVDILEGSGRVDLDVTGLRSPLAWPADLPVRPGVDVGVTVLTGDEWEDDPDQPWMHLQVIDTRYSGAYGSEFQRVARLLGRDDDFAAWWAHAPFRTLILRICVPYPTWNGDVPRPGARKQGKDLVLQVVTDGAGLPAKSEVEALKVRARQDLHAALVDLALARKLPPPPPLPPRIGMNAREARARART